MDIALRNVIPPHKVNDPTRLASLVAAYNDDRPVTPVVALAFGDGLAFALSGSHRVAAAREAYEEDAGIVECLGWILVDGEALYATATPDVQARLDTLQAGHAGDFAELIAALMAYLPEPAKAALADQV